MRAPTIALTLLLPIAVGCGVHTAPFRDANGNVVPGSIARMESASIGGIPQQLWFRGLSTGAPALILLHGGTAKGKSSGYAVALAEVLARAGFIVLAIDMQLFGERATPLLTKFTEVEKHDRLYNQKSTYLAWIAQLVKDVGRSVDFLASQRNVDAKRVGLLGISRGAESGIIVAGADRRLTPVVLFFGGHFDALETGHLPAACPANYIGRISPRPLLMINGEADSDYDKVTAVDPLYARARQPKKIIWSVAGHMGFTDRDLSEMTEWLRDHVK